MLTIPWAGVGRFESGHGLTSELENKVETEGGHMMKVGLPIEPQKHPSHPPTKKHCTHSRLIEVVRSPQAPSQANSSAWNAKPCFPIPCSNSPYPNRQLARIGLAATRLPPPERAQTRAHSQILLRAELQLQQQMLQRRNARRHFRQHDIDPLHQILQTRVIPASPLLAAAPFRF